MSASHITPYKNSELTKKEQVTQMFDNISGNYDGLNRVISMGIDIKWRQKVLQIVAEHQPDSLLDIATGTGDLAILMSATSANKIVGLDLSKDMLAVGIKKVAQRNLAHKIEMLVGDSEAIPFAENTFDAATVSFGIRNFETLEKGLAEILRVMKPGGLFVILETSVPTNFFFRVGYLAYTNYLLPLIGKLFSKDKSAYGYLSASAQNFPYGEKLNVILRKVGFEKVTDLPQSLGIATIYTAYKKA